MCCAATTDFERWPEWARDVEDVRVLDRSDDGRPRRVLFAVELMGKDYGATLDFDLTPAPAEVTFTLVEARKLRSVEGWFRFSPTDGETLMTFRIVAELVKPKPPRMERMFARRIETMLVRDLKRHIERNFARPR